MSASLVGSEMCIRDRCRAGGVHSSAPGKYHHVLCVQEWACTGAVPCAVSYTHLTLPTICSV
eukprot:1277473-Alexandrium_andersonii.AAC.1